MHKVGNSLWGPVHSYFYECMRGASVIRAFNQEDFIMSRQHELLDKTTSHFIGNNSCWSWYHLRMQYASNLINIFVVFMIAYYRTSVSTPIILGLFQVANDFNGHVSPISHLVEFWSAFKNHVV